MEHTQLLAFLKYAVDLEGAAYACDQTIESLDCTLRKRDDEYFRIPKPIFPEPPECEAVFIPSPVSRSREEVSEEAKEDYNKWQRKEDLKSVLKNKKMIKFYLIAAGINAVYGLLVYHQLPNIMSYVMLFLLVGAVGYLCRYKKMKAQYCEQCMREYDAKVTAYEQAKQEEKAAQRRYELAMQEHELACNELENQWARERQAAHQVVERYRDELRKQREAVLKRRTELKAKLEWLYNEHGFYESYRNLLAVTQICEYIASGVSEKLEGVDGAYAQYAADLRAERVCASVEDLRRDMNRGFDRVTGMTRTLMIELKKCGETLEGLQGAVVGFGNNVSAMIRGIQSETRVLSGNVQSQLEASERRQERLLSSLNQIETSSAATAFNTSVITFNQYLDATRRGGEAYYVGY